MTSPKASEAGRCPWPGEDPLYVAYHDEEWGVPEYDDRALFEKLVLDGFQAGLSWITILRKRESFREAFDGFEPERIVRYKPARVEKLLQNPGIIRHRGKIEATIGNARAWLDIMEEDSGFSGFLWDIAGGAPKQNKWKRIGRAGRNADERRDVEGAEGARFQILRTDDRLCVRAGGRHGQRSSRELSATRRLFRIGAK